MSEACRIAIAAGCVTALAFLIIAELPFLFIGETYGYVWYKWNWPLSHFVGRHFGLLVTQWVKHALIVGLNAIAWAGMVSGLAYAGCRLYRFLLA